MEHVIFKTGIVWDSRPGYAKVQFDEENDEQDAGDAGFTTDWLPQLFHATLGEQVVSTLKKNAQVECLMQANLKTGVILGCSYNDEDTPPTTDADTYVHKFEDGTFISYKKGSGSDGILTADVKGDVSIKISGKLDAEVTGETTLKTSKLKVQGDVEVIGKISATDNIETQKEVKATIDVSAGPLNIKLTTHKHLGVQTGSGTSGTPTP